MEYQKVDDPEAVAQESLKTEARQKEELAWAAECSVDELNGQVAAKLTKDPTIGRQIETLKEHAKALRKEADVYAKAAGLTEDEIKSLRTAYLHRWMEMTERTHIQHSAILQVRSQLGQETASHDSILAGLDIAHDLAITKIAELEGRKATRAEKRTAPRAK